MFSLRKRAPIESLLTSTGVNPSFSSQEPRRPRFSFFLSSQCQRADHSAVAGINRHRKQCLQNSARKQDLVAGCPADQPALAENRQQWERNSLSVVNVAGLYSTPNSVSTPYFRLQCRPEFLPTSTNPKTRNSEFLLCFSGLPQSSVPRGASLCSGDRVYRGDDLACKPPSFIKLTFCVWRSRGFVENSTEDIGIAGVCALSSANGDLAKSLHTRKPWSFIQLRSFAVFFLDTAKRLI